MLGLLTDRIEEPTASLSLGHRPSPTVTAQSDSNTVDNRPREDLERRLQRGNLQQVLAWDVWRPHQPRESGLASVRTLDYNHESPTFSNSQHVDLKLFAVYLDAFFRNVHVLNPVLDENEVRSQLTHLLLAGIDWEATTCLLLLILANGACSKPFASVSTSRTAAADDQEWASARALYQAAEKRRSAIWRGDYLIQARYCFYEGVFMMASMRPHDAWRQFLQGLATCQFLVAQTATEPPNSADNQAIESIYWSCWKSERELRSELDLPDFACARVYDHPLSFPSIPQAARDGQHREWYFFLAEVSLWRFEMMARKSMTDAVEHGRSDIETLAERVQDLETALESWHASLPEGIRFGTNPADDPSDILLYVLRGRLTYTHEILTWPFLEHQIHATEHNDSRTTTLVAKGLQFHCDRLNLNRPGFFYQHHGTWLMQRSSARSALVLLAFARSSRIDLLPLEWVELVADTIDMLEFWSRDDNHDLITFMRDVFVEIKERIF